MIVQFVDRVTGVAAYINPEYVVMMRPDPEHPLDATIVKLSDGETLKVSGDHREVAEKLRPAMQVAVR